MKIRYKRSVKASSGGMDYADLKGMDFKKARDILTKDGFSEHEYGDKDDNNGYAVYRKGNKEVELQYRWNPGKRKNEYHAGKVTNVYVDDDINASCGKKSVKAGYQLQFPYMVEGEFADGYTYTAGGNSEGECVETLANMQDKHGELVWYSGITDEDYDAGRRIDSACGGKKKVKAAHYKAKPGGWNWDNPETNHFIFLYKHNWRGRCKTLDECLAAAIETVGIDNIISEGVEIAKVNSAGYTIERWDPSEVYQEARGISTVEASTGNRHRSKIMAGAGAGYTIKWALDSINSINSFKVVNVSRMDNYGNVTVTADCDINVTVTIDSANSYMYGFNTPIENVSAKITRIIFDMYTPDWSFLDSSDYENGEDDEAYQEAVISAIYEITEADAGNILESEAWDTIKGDEFNFGGGWIHTTYDGTLNEIDGDYNWVDIKITDEAVINYIDRCVTGDCESTSYFLFDQDNESFEESYYDLKEAESVAWDLVDAGEVDYITIWAITDFEQLNGDIDTLDDRYIETIPPQEPDEDLEEELPWEHEDY